jgi:TonB family protein
MRLFALAAALSIALVRPALAQPASDSRAWQVDWDEHDCTLVRLPHPGSPFFVDFRTLPGNFTTALRVTRDDSRSPVGRISSVVLLPSGQSFAANEEIAERRRGRRAVGADDLPESFWDALAGTTELQLRRGDNVAARIPLHSPATAIQSLRQCVSSAMARWGLDEAALRALRSLPESTNLMGFTPEDYPAAAGRASGRVTLRISVSAAGRATACVVLVSAGHRLLDERACQVVMARARFTPAIDANGQPIDASYAFSVNWIGPYS